MNEETTQAPTGQPEPTTAATAATVEPTTEKKLDAPSENKFDGKSPEELAKSYQELQKKLGEQSSEVGELRKYREQMDTVLQAIWADTNVYQAVDAQIKKMQNLTDEPLPSPTDDTNRFVIDDTRAAIERKTISDFEKQYSIDSLPEEKRREMHGKIGNALRDLVDPSGRKTTAEVIRSISLEKLPAFLDNAYLLANKDKFMESITSRREAELGSIGSLPSSGTRSSELELSQLEKETAKKMGIPEDRFQERKKQIIEERNKGV